MSGRLRSSGLPDGACWDVGAALAILKTEALGNDGATFLATHTPIASFTVNGIESANVRENTERGLLEALRDPGLRHAFAVVQGEPGSGKSHLIRWLAEMWPAGRDITVLLRRAEASLEGSLRGLRDAVPEQYRDIVGEIELRQVKSVKGRIADFVSNLGNSLDPDYYDQPPSDRDFCERFAPGDIMKIDEVRTDWAAPKRLVNLMSGAAADGAAGGRNSQSASFNVNDVCDLADYADKVSKFSAKAGRLLRAIGKECDFVDQSEKDGIPPDRLLTTHRHGTPHAADLTDALNARRNHAIQSSIGITASKLKGIFLDLRRALKRDGDRRLVILLEDITAWEGVDDSLVDVLIDDARTAGGSLCDLLSIVGVTPYYFQTMKANYQQRVTHDIGLGDGGDGFQEVANLRDAPMRARFVSTYLRAIRAGISGIEGWRAAMSEGAMRPVPNRCDECPFDARTRCHRSFGAFEGIGLYPFSEKAIENFYFALKRQDQGMTWRTPRGIIQGILAPTLTRPEALASERYPTREIEIHTGIDRDQTYVTGFAQARLKAAIGDAEERERAGRLIALWGDRDDARTRETSDGDVSFAEVPRSIFETFGIQWLGDEAADPVDHIEDVAPDEPTARDQGAPAETPIGSDTGKEEPQGQPDAGETRLKAAPRPATTPGAKPAEVKRGTDKPKQISQKEVAGFLVEIRSFQTDGFIKTPSRWNEFTRELLERIDVLRLGVDDALFRILFKEDQIKVKGTSKVGRGSYFEVPTEDWFLEGLEAYARLRYGEHFFGLLPNEQDWIRRRVARCLRRLEALARAHVERMTPRLDDGSPWSSVAAATQVLAVRAWLRGDLKPTAPPLEQWLTLLNGEGAVATDPRSRVDSWDAILRKTNSNHTDIRNHVVEAVRLAQGDGKNYGLTDAAVPIDVIGSLQREFRLCERPKEMPKDAADILKKIWEAVETTSDRFFRMPTDEFERLKGRAERIEKARRDNGIADHLKRVTGAIRKADDGLPPASKQNAAVALLRSCDELLLAADAGPRIEAVEGCLMTMLYEQKPEKRLLTLEIVAAQPAADLEAVDKVTSEAERVIGIMKVALEAFVGRNRSGALTLEQIQQKGADVADAATSAAARWNGDA